MTKEDIIRMAHEVFDVQTDSRERTTFSGDSYAIEAFAALVASAERDRMCEQFNLSKELAHEKAKSNEAN